MRVHPSVNIAYTALLSTTLLSAAAATALSFSVSTSTDVSFAAAAARFLPSRSDLLRAAAQPLNCTTRAAGPPYDAQAWQVPFLGTYAPSGRDASSRPSVGFGFFDPNTCLATNCSADWDQRAQAPAEYTPCEDAAVRFRFVGYQVSRFTMFLNYVFVDDAGSSVNETGSADFRLVGECGGSGVCYFGLNHTVQYVPIDK